MKDSLLDLAAKYFRRRGYTIEQNVTLEGLSGSDQTFDLLIKKGDEVHPVWVKDWRRTVGVNVIINMDRAASDVKLSNPIVISNKFSEHAKSYAKRRNVKLLTRRDIT